MSSDKSLEIGDTVIIKDGRALGRSNNPSEKITVKIIGKRSASFFATSKHSEDEYVYRFEEIIEVRSERFVFR